MLIVWRRSKLWPCLSKHICSIILHEKIIIQISPHERRMRWWTMQEFSKNMSVRDTNRQGKNGLRRYDLSTVR